MKTADLQGAALVASKLGDEVEIPKELQGEKE